MNKKGIILETDIDEESLVLVDPEILGQLLFTLVKRAFHQSSHNQLVRRLSIKSKNLGGTVLVEMRDSGNGFESDIVTMPLNVLMQEKKLETDLQICAELVKDINTQMILANYYDRTLDERGGQIQLIFERVETKQTDDQQKKVVKRKGTKKEILRNLR
jgi:C4-dicarboxylate-specific signal transduction histidine kinase